MKNKTLLAAMSGAALLGAAVTGVTTAASADTTTGTQTASVQASATSTHGWMHGKHLGWLKGAMHAKHDVRGTVTAVNGTTITLTGKNGTTYTVDAASAKLNKVIDITAADVKVGDTLNAQGTLSGTSLSATHIMDGIPAAPAR